MNVLSFFKKFIIKYQVFLFELPLYLDLLEPQNENRLEMQNSFYSILLFNHSSSKTNRHSTGIHLVYNSSSIAVATPIVTELGYVAATIAVDEVAIQCAVSARGAGVQQSIAIDSTFPRSVPGFVELVTSLAFLYILQAFPAGNNHEAAIAAPESNKMIS